MLAVARRRLITPRQALAVPAYPASVLATPNLLAFYRLQETSGSVVTDSGPNGYHGSLVGSPTRGVAGPLVTGGTDVGYGGWSGSNYVSMSNSLSVTDNQSLTIEFWYKLTGSAGDTSTAFVFGNPAGSANRIQAHLPYSNTVYFDDGQFNSGGRTSFAWNAAWTNAWAHYAFVADATANTLTVYVNATQQSQLTGWSKIGDTFTGGSIGNWNGGALFADGPIAEFAVYSAALSQATLLSHYNNR